MCDQDSVMDSHCLSLETATVIGSLSLGVVGVAGRVGVTGCNDVMTGIVC